MRAGVAGVEVRARRAGGERGRAEGLVARLLGELLERPEVHLARGADGAYGLAERGDDQPVDGRRIGSVPATVVGRLATAGLLAANGAGGYRASDAAAAWLKRAAQPELAFLAQHKHLERGGGGPGASDAAYLDHDESPVAALSRRLGKAGAAFLPAHAVAAAERLRRDFEIGNLQPRVTSDWSGTGASGRGGGRGSGLGDLTDMATAARGRFERAAAAVGPELMGPLVDICCFLKGLELVERERQWPARSAKLALKLGLDSLARHYGLTGEAEGGPGGRVRRWGAEDYRPAIS